MEPISCNTYIKALNAFCKWLHDEGHLAERLELRTLKLEKRILLRGSIPEKLLDRRTSSPALLAVLPEFRVVSCGRRTSAPP